MEEIEICSNQNHMFLRVRSHAIWKRGRKNNRTLTPSTHVHITSKYFSKNSRKIPYSSRIIFEIVRISKILERTSLGFVNVHARTTDALVNVEYPIELFVFAGTKIRVHTDASILPWESRWRVGVRWVYHNPWWRLAEAPSKKDSWEFLDTKRLDKSRRVWEKVYTKQNLNVRREWDCLTATMNRVTSFNRDQLCNNSSRAARAERRCTAGANAASRRCLLVFWRSRVKRNLPEAPVSDVRVVTWGSSWSHVGSASKPRRLFGELFRRHESNVRTSGSSHHHQLSDQQFRQLIVIKQRNAWQRVSRLSSHTHNTQIAHHGSWLSRPDSSVFTLRLIANRARVRTVCWNWLKFSWKHGKQE